MRDYLRPPTAPKSMWKNPLHFIAFGFGAGAIPIAPGTFGTLMGIPFYLLMQPLSLTLYLLITVAIIVGSIWISEKVSHEIGIHDHQGMCLDEIVGFLVTMISVPHGFMWIAAGFLLFRLFDIWKPWPICYVDKHIGGGLGVILDDVLAGILACFVLHGVAMLIIT